MTQAFSYRIRNFPISFLAVCLGLIGYTLAWQKAEQILDLDVVLSGILLNLTFIVMAVVFVLYLVKILKYHDQVKKEFNHPIKLNFFPILAKLFLITSLIYIVTDINVSRYLWWVGVVIQFVFTIVIMSTWIRHEKFQIQHINPSWFIPVVGAIIIPIAGVRHFDPELSWFFFSIGFFWWIILTTIVFYRIIFHQPIPQKLIPTLFILFAPPIIGFIALTKLLGGLSIFGNLMYYFGLFLFILIMFQFPMFSKLEFNLPWWAYSFPLDALAIGTFLMYEETSSVFFYYFSWFIFIILNLVIILLVIKTTVAIKRKNLCVEEKGE